MVQETRDAAQREYRMLGSAVHWRDEPPRQAAAPPDLGQHSDEVLQEWLGYSSDRIAGIRATGALGGAAE
jgi:formyl-CoA transferase